MNVLTERNGAEITKRLVKTLSEIDNIVWPEPQFVKKLHQNWTSHYDYNGMLKFMHPRNRVLKLMGRRIFKVPYKLRKACDELIDEGSFYLADYRKAPVLDRSRLICGVLGDRVEFLRRTNQERSLVDY